MKKVQTDKAPQALGPYSQATAAGDLVFCSGQIGLDPKTGNLVSGGIKQQTVQVLANLNQVLLAAGSSLSGIVKTEVYLKDLNDFTEMNEEYSKIINGAIKPARVTVEVSRLPKDALIEISCVAVKNKKMKNKLTVELVDEAYKRLKGTVVKTPLEKNHRLSEKYQAEVYLKREDLQLVRSYKLRGAYNRIALLNKSEKAKGIVCASAGNHAQGVAFGCAKLKVKGDIYMPKNTPKQKVGRVKFFGGDWINLHLVGDTFDDSYLEAKKYCDQKKKTFIHPFDDLYVMAGQGTVGLEILEQLGTNPDYVFVPIGGGGLVAGLSTYLKAKDKKIKVVGVEPLGAPSMSEALKVNHVVTLSKIDKFVDGAAVKTIGENTFVQSKDKIDSMLLVPEGRVCEEMISVYQNDGIITEPAGVLSVAALDQLAEKIRGKKVVCVVSGGNNDISRYPEIVERSLIYKGLKHYFLIEFSQRPGALREYLDKVLGSNDDITLFEYLKKSNKETGPALIGLELSNKNDLEPLLKRMAKYDLKYELLDRQNSFSRFLV